MPCEFLRLLGVVRSQDGSDAFGPFLGDTGDDAGRRGITFGKIEQNHFE